MAHIRSTTAVQSATATAVTVTLPATAPAGRTLLIALAWEAAAGNVPTITSIVDSRGNTYTTTPDAGAVSGTTMATAVVRGRVTTALQAGDTITITISASRTRWVVQVDEFDDPIAAPLDKTVTNAPSTSSAALTTGTTAALAQPSELLYAVFGFAGSGRTATIPGGWSGGPIVSTAAGSAERNLVATWRYAGTAAAAEATLQLSTASTYAAVLGTYKIPAQPVARIAQVFIGAPAPGDALLARISRVSIVAPRAVTGEARISQVSLTAPTRPGQPPYSGIKTARGGALWDAAISAAVDGTV